MAMSQPYPAAGDYPDPAPVLEEACAAHPADTGAALAFALARLGGPGSRMPMLVAPRRWLLEHGRPFAPAIVPHDACLLLIATRNEEDALWAMEQGLRSGALCGVIGAVERASLTQTRRLDFAAREGGSVAVLLRAQEGGLSAARRRWRIAAAPSAADPHDAKAPGGWRVQAELTRRRDGPPGNWILEQDDGTNRLRLVARLADHGLVADGRTIAAA
jgi:protein ImuA